MLKRFFAAAALAAAASSSFAAQPGAVYAGVAAGVSRYQGENDGSYGAFLGYQINDKLAVEAGHRRIASEGNGTFDTRLDQTTLSVLGSIPMSNAFSVYGRVGVARVSAEVYAAEFGTKAHQNKPLAGVGVSYKFSDKITGRAELQRTMDTATNLGVGIGYSF